MTRAALLGVIVGLALCALLGAATGFAMGDEGAHRGRAAVACLAAGAWAMALRRRAQERPLDPRVEHGGAALLATLAVGAFFAFGSPRTDRPYHRHDAFHYYLASKYSHALGYKRLYVCAAVAVAEVRGPESLRGHTLRDLDRNVVAPASAALRRGDECRAAFGAEWPRFREDVRWFRADCDDAYWDEILNDHGYNPPPTWSLVGGVVTRATDASATTLARLAWLDPALLIGVFLCVAWGFGATAACVAVIVWGCQEAGSFTWLYGTLLRQDWLFAVALGVAALRRRRWALAGAALTIAAMLRAFPAVFLLGPAAVFARDALRSRRLAPEARRFAAGAAVTLALLGGASAAAQPGAWTAWVAHIRQHEGVVASNRIGLPPLSEYGLATRLEAMRTSPHRWVEARRSRARDLALPRRAVALVFVSLVLAALAVSASPWIAAVLAFALLFPLTGLNSYYYIALVLFAPLTRLGDRWALALLRWLAVTQTLLAMPAFAFWYDDRFATLTVCVAALEGAAVAPWALRALRRGIRRRAGGVAPG